MMTWLKKQLPALRTALTDYGMVFVLMLLCGYFAVVTWEEQYPRGLEAAQRLAHDVSEQHGPGARVLIVVRTGNDDAAFAAEVAKRVEAQGLVVVDVVHGDPRATRETLEADIAAGERIDVIATTNSVAAWSLFDNLGERFPELAQTQHMAPRTYRGSTFLRQTNLVNIADNTAIYAIIAIGMTMVIITAGIDLSVGSLVALSAVVTARLVRDWGGAEEAGAAAMVLAAMGGIAVCGLSGLFSGAMVTLCRIPPFIVTLAMMLIASGMAYILAHGQSINAVPDSFTWLGRGIGASLDWGPIRLAVPNSVILMIGLYVGAHLLMTRTTLGRYIYAVGGNAEAARLSGVPVRRVVMFVYVACAMLAGLGGVVLASQLKSGAPTYGQMYELYVIAAVVVGGTSLMGGEGKILGTLIGAFIIAVIRNGMNLTNVESYTQNVVLGMVIVGAVLLDTLRRRGVGDLIGKFKVRRPAEAGNPKPEIRNPK